MDHVIVVAHVGMEIASSASRIVYERRSLHQNSLYRPIRSQALIGAPIGTEVSALGSVAALELEARLT